MSPLNTACVGCVKRLTSKVGTNQLRKQRIIVPIVAVADVEALAANGPARNFGVRPGNLREEAVEDERELVRVVVVVRHGAAAVSFGFVRLAHFMVAYVLSLNYYC